MKTLRSLKVDLLGQLVISSFQIFTIPLVISELGEDSYGIWLTVLALISWSIIGDFGFATNLTRAIINNEENIAAKKRELAAINLVLGIMLGLIYFFMLEFWFGSKYAGFWPISIAIFLNINLTTLTAQIEASKHQSKLRLRGHFSKLIELSAYVYVAVLYPRIEFFSWVYLLSILLKFVLYSHLYISVLHLKDIIPIFNLRNNLDDFKDSIYLQANKLINNYTIYADILIIGYFSLEQVSKYSNNLIFWQYACLLLGSKVSINIFPIMDRFGRNYILKESFLVLNAFIGLAGAILYYFIGVKILNVWIEDVAIDSEIWVIIMSFFLLTEFLTRSLGNLIYINKSMTKKYLKTASVEIVLNFVLTIIFYSCFELMGVLLATLISRIAFTLRFILQNNFSFFTIRTVVYRFYVLLFSVIAVNLVIPNILSLFLSVGVIGYVYRSYSLRDKLNNFYA
jgi:O-antigen/teichoic acid export membrane protein